MPEKRFAPGQKKLTGSEKRAILRRLWGYMLHSRGLFLLAILMVVGSNAFSLLGPLLSGWAVGAIGEVAGGVDFDRLFLFVGLMALFYLLSAIFSYVLAVLMVHISQRVTVKMRRDVFDRLLSLPVSYFDKTQTGDILSVISYDVATVNESLSHDLVHIITSTVTIVGSFGMMLYISPPLCAVFAVTIPLSVFLTRFITSHTRPLFRRRSKKLGEMNGYAEEMIGGIGTIRAYHTEQAVSGRFGVHNDEAVDTYTRAEYYGSVTGPCVNFINNLSLTLVSVLGALLCIGAFPMLGTIGLEEITSFLLYSRKFSGPINEIANMYGELQSSFSAAERVFGLIDEAPEKPDVPGALSMERARGHVEMKDVSFAYPGGKPVLSHFNLEAKPGSLIAIVGPTGAGKTTVINLLMRFYDVDGGDILIDGVPIRTLTRKDLRRQFTMVLQETWLFSGTVAENIAYGREDATREEIEEAARAAHIHGFIESLPHGYDTVLSGGGVSVSRGQKQLITVARAMLSRAPMLILDEATSNVDTRTEGAIRSAMRRLMQDRTCFVIAHRLSTVEHADQILVMKDGTVAEAGTHEELLARGGVYAGLYRSQFDTTG